MGQQGSSIPSMSLGNAWRDAWIGHKRAREALLTNAICTTDDWIAYTVDPDLGNIGERFMNDVKKSGCQQEIDIHHDGIADYYSFSYGKRKGFVNHIVYGPQAEEDLANLFSSKVHEETHALQKMQSAALHASPFNPNTRIVICPRDWIMLEERCEQDAYVKQALFNSLLATQIPEIIDLGSKSALTVEDFDLIRKSVPTIQDALPLAASKALQKSFYWDNPDSEYKFRNHYHDHSLKNYTAGMNMRQKNGEYNLIFVRVEPEDIIAIGTSAGIDTFGGQAEFLAPPPLLQKTQDTLATLNSRLNIYNEDTLPTLSEALRDMGMTREQFIAQSYTTSVASVQKLAPCVPA